MTDEVHRSAIKLCDERGYIRDEAIDPVVRDSNRSIGFVVAAQVRCNGSKSGVRQSSQLMTPRIPEFGEAMQQDDNFPLPCLGNAEIYRIDLNGAVKKARRQVKHR